jgi:methionyl-tRNA synthetase
LPAAADAIAGQLAHPALASWAEIGAKGSLRAGTALAQPQPMYPRLEKEEARKPMTEPKAKPKPETPEPKEATSTDPIGIEQFAQVQLKVARVVEAEPVENSDKLLKLQIVIGSERRQIVAGIRKSYTPEDLIGRQIVVVANLKPATLRGVESQGMVLAAVDESGEAILLQPDREAPEGALVR